MADSGALLASLLQQQRAYGDPLQAQRKYGQDLIVKGSSTAPLGSGNPLEGLARALQAGIGGWVAGSADREEKANNEANVNALTAASTATTSQALAAALKGVRGNSDTILPILGQITQGRLNDILTQEKAGTAYNALQPGGAAGGGQSPTPGMGGNGTSITITPNARAISATETGGQPNDGYGAIGPVANAQGHRAYGKFQVLEPNIGPWTQEVVGKAMTPQEFLANPEAQNKVFETKFGQYTTKYGSPQAASRAWFAGEGGMNNPNARDVNGMTPGRYEQQFAQNGGGAAPGVPGAVAQPPVQPAQGAEAAPVLPPQLQAPTQSPAGNMYRQQAQQAHAQGRNDQALAFAQEAIKADAGFAQDVAKSAAQKQNETAIAGAEHDRTFAMSNAEHDRQQATATPSEMQALSATYADRMRQAGPILNQHGASLASPRDRALDTTVLGVGVPGANYMVSKEYQQARQARDNFINAQLRRESGSAINPDEYAKADKQYIPQPGDAPETLALKAQNRETAINGMARAAGPTYPTTQQPAPPATTNVGGVSDGATATNPQTGQKITFRGGQWVPAQ